MHSTGRVVAADNLQQHAQGSRGPESLTMHVLADEVKESAVATPTVEPSSEIPSGNSLADLQPDSLPAPPEPSADAEKENEITVSLYRHHEVCPWPLCADAVICVALLAHCHMSV